MCEREIKIKPLVINDNCIIDEDFWDSGSIEASYDIQKLKLAIVLNGKTVKPLEFNSHGQAFITEFDIWINKDEYEFA